jgi:hypothetical protein
VAVRGTTDRDGGTLGFTAEAPDELRAYALQASAGSVQ